MADRKKLEILSPAGDLEKLKTAVCYGADAVYMSGKRFGLRTFSGNFTHEEMVEGISYAHAHGVKAYVTMNILATEADIKAVDEEIDFIAHVAKADAVLVSDPGIFARVKAVAPDLDIHISTQASTMNSAACKFWYDLGATRVVLAREVSLKQLKQMKETLPEDLEIECFVHGAMCMSYSGRCLLSNYFTGRRSNGGACAQPCRWGYHLVEEKRPDEKLPVMEDERGTYILSSKDICMVEHVPEMIEAGVNSFKIEGRIKGAYYAAAATKVYREAVDLYCSSEDYKTDPRWLELLDKVVHRDYATGFFFDAPEENAQICEERTYNKPAFVVGLINSYDEETGLYKVTQKNKLFKGDTINVLKPVGYQAPIVITELFNEWMQPIESTPHAEMTYYMRCNSEEILPEMTFLSRDGDKDGGIKPLS